MIKNTLQELRLKKKLTQETAAKELHIAKEYLSAIERGKRNPSDKLKLKMAKLYGVKEVIIFVAWLETKRFKKEEQHGRVDKSKGIL